MKTLIIARHGNTFAKGEISPAEFKGFIGEDIRLEEVTLENAHNLKEILRFYMGDNTDDRRQYIVDNLRIEEDLA